MNRLGFLALCLLLAGAIADAAAAEPVTGPAQYGDRQAGSFGDIDQGHFGDTAVGNFVENNFPRGQEGQVRAVEAVPTRSGQSLFRKPAPAPEAPYVTLPKPADAAR